MTAFHIFLLLVLAPFAVVVDLGLLLVAWAMISAVVDRLTKRGIQPPGYSGPR